MSQQHAPDPFGPLGTLWGRRTPTLTGTQRALLRHAWAYAVSTVALCVFWRATDTAYFTPLLPVTAWGAGLGVHAWWVFRGSDAARGRPTRRQG